MPRQPAPAPFDGALVIDKPKGKTSHDVVDAVRHWRGCGRSGIWERSIRWRQVCSSCSGASDAARAVLFGAEGSGTRRDFGLDLRRIRLIPTARRRADAAPPTMDRTVLERFAAERVGRFEQMPPAFSAKKIHGRPAYELARKKQVVELKPVEVEVFEYKLTEIEGYIARFVIECSSGTYIRALAHEMGQKLGCGAHLAEISRLAVGEFSLQQAIKLEELAEGARAGKFPDYLIKLENFLPNFPRAKVLPIVERRVRHGTKFNVTVSQIQPGRVEAAPGATSELDGGEPKLAKLRVFNQQNKLIAIAEAVVPRTYQPVVVFEPMG